MTTKQRSSEWFEQRKGRLTGSRIGAILGASPWQKPADVMRAMVREHHNYPSEFEGNPATQHGVNNEQRALLCFMRETGLNVEECGFFPYGERLGASPDGLTSDGGVLELKVPFSLRNGGEFKPLKEQPHYEAQVQMELLATGRKHAHFAQYIAPKGDPLSIDYVPEQIKIERVEFDPGWIDAHLPALNDFYRQYLLELDNKEHLEPLRVQLLGDDTKALLAEFDECRRLQAEYSKREKELLAMIVDMAGEKDAEIHGRKLTKVVRSGSVSWAKVAKEVMPEGFDLAPFTGEPCEYWRLT